MDSTANNNSPFLTPLNCWTLLLSPSDSHSRRLFSPLQQRSIKRGSSTRRFASDLATRFPRSPPPSSLLSALSLLLHESRRKPAERRETSARRRQDLVGACMRESAVDTALASPTPPLVRFISSCLHSPLTPMLTFAPHFDYSQTSLFDGLLQTTTTFHHRIPPRSRNGRALPLPPHLRSFWNATSSSIRPTSSSYDSSSRRC